MGDVDERTRERYEPIWPEPADPLALPARRRRPPPWLVGGAIALGLVFLGVALAEFVRLPTGFLFFFVVGPWIFLRRRRNRR